MQTTSTVHFVVPKGGIRPNIRPSTNIQSLPLASLPEALSEQGSPGERPGKSFTSITVSLCVRARLCPYN